MTPLVVILLIVLVLCLVGGGWGYRSGTLDANVPGLLYLVLVVLIIVWLLRTLGVV